MKIRGNGINIDAKSSIKYLGVVLDQNTRGKSLGCNVVKKVNSVLNIFIS